MLTYLHIYVFICHVAIFIIPVNGSLMRGALGTHAVSVEATTAVTSCLMHCSSAIKTESPFVSSVLAGRAKP